MNSLKPAIGRCMVFVVGAALLLGSGMASAVQVLTTGDDQQIATAILNLDVGENQFNVNFKYGTAADIYSGGFDVDNLPDTILMRDAIVQALNDHNLQSTNDATHAGTVFNNDVDFYIAWSDSSESQVSAERGHHDEFDWVSSGNALLPNGNSYAWATFTAVPEPSTATLMTLGLIGLASRRRRS
jgi:hypothetical protein